MRVWLISWVVWSMPMALLAQPNIDFDNVISVHFPEILGEFYFVSDTQIYTQGWDTLSQVVFWQKIMDTPRDTSIINIYTNRQILGKLPTSWYDGLPSKMEKRQMKMRFKKFFQLMESDDIFITSGKKEYYQIPSVIPDINEAVCVFMEEEVDPWYAQSILLIESPGVLRLSPVGAYGPFQLMRGIAIKQGLVVNSEIDERADIQKSARAAAQFIRDVCLPETRRILNRRNIPFDEGELWFKLLVLHVYHSGAGNVNSAMKRIPVVLEGPSIVRRLWHTRSRGFGNASQNYSQIALAALLMLEEVIYDMKGYVVNEYFRP